MGDGRYERLLVRALTECWMPAMRAPTSGSATTRDLQDVIAGQAYVIDGVTGSLKTLSDCYAIEAKSGKSTTLYLDGEPPESEAWPGEAGRLGRFAQEFGATPCVGARFKRPGGGRTPFYLVPLSACRRTESGNYSVPEAIVEERALAAVYPAISSMLSPPIRSATMPDGPIDHDYTDAERSYQDQLEDALENIQTEPMPGDVAIDLVTRQPVFVHDILADP